MDDERREPLRLVGETADTVTMLRADYEGLLSKLDDAEDRAAVLEHQLAKKTGAIPETADTVTMQRADYEDLLSELEDAEDRAAVLEHQLAKKTGAIPDMLTLEEADRRIAGENPVKFWRDKRGYTQRSLAGMAGVSVSLLSEIEAGTKTGSVDTLRKLAQVLKVDLDPLAP